MFSALSYLLKYRTKQMINKFHYLPIKFLPFLSFSIFFDSKLNRGQKTTLRNPVTFSSGRRVTRSWRQNWMSGHENPSPLFNFSISSGSLTSKSVPNQCELRKNKKTE